MSDSQRPVPKLAILGVLLLALAGTLGGVFGGPALGDHEAIVAQCARDMRLSGDWLVPTFLDTPFIRKPPLPYWSVAALSYLFANDPATGLPVTTTVARLPSALAAFGTVLLIWWLGSSMFDRRTGLIAAVIAASSLFFMLYGANATTEMILTFCCTWAYAHFWFAVTAGGAGRRLLHLFFFYFALGMAMLAKGPAPIAMVCAPLVFWWYTERPLRVLARCGPRRIRLVFAAFFRGLWPRTAQAFTRLWLLPGLVVFALVFVPWMWAVAERHPYAWNLWNWQYVQRAQGDYEDTRVRGFFYYLPVVAGYLVPWVFLVFEGLAAPWMKRYARYRRALIYVGLWGGISFLAMSAMTFKKPYYVSPAVPGLLLLMVVVARRAFAYRVRSPRVAWTLWAILLVAAFAGLAGGAVWLRNEVPAAWVRLAAITAGGMVALAVAGAVFIRARGWLSLGIAGTASVAVFLAAWYVCGPTVDNVDKVAALARALDQAQVPPEAHVLWADQRPDARLSFYFKRHSEHMIDPQEIVTKMVDRTAGEDVLRRMAVERAAELLQSPNHVYLIMDFEHYSNWSRFVGLNGGIIATVDCDPTSDDPDEDWVVVSNRPQALAEDACGIAPLAFR